MKRSAAGKVGAINFREANMSAPALLDTLASAVIQSVGKTGASETPRNNLRESCPGVAR
jgi:hypothetical protein